MHSARAHVMLARTPGLTAEHVRALVALTGELDAALVAAARESNPVPLPQSARAWLASPDEAEIEADLRWLESTGAHAISCLSPEYPQLLATTPGAPAMLYVLGDVNVLSTPQLAMVGSRNPTASGRATARDFAQFFARIGLTITSGLALGIDAASHQGALLGDGSTIAVCGCGLDQVYPREHVELAARIRERGAMVSEFAPRTPPLKPYFPQRNRIISGLAFGTLVVEAARGSGSLITAKHANDQGREVFAIPGSIHSPLSRGCHQLIREGAKLVESAEDVLSELKNFLEPQTLAMFEAPAGASAKKPHALDKDYEMLLDALGFEPTSIDVLVERTGLPNESVASMLLILELEGRIAPHAGGRYGRINR